MLKTLDPGSLNDAPQTVMLDLPEDAKRPATILRWWQPIISPGTVAKCKVVLVFNNVSGHMPIVSSGKVKTMCMFSVLNCKTHIAN